MTSILLTFKIHRGKYKVSSKAAVFMCDQRQTSLTTVSCN